MLRFLSLLFCASVALVFIRCSRNEKTETADRTTMEKSHHVPEVTGVTKRGDMVPNFTWNDASGKAVDFDSFRGKVTLLNFWATWCGPCKKEIPDLVALSNELSSTNVKIIGVATDRGPNALGTVQEYVDNHNISYLNVVANSDLEEAFGNIRMIPTSFLINAEGKIAQTIVGLRTKEFYRQAINSLL